MVALFFKSMLKIHELIFLGHIRATAVSCEENRNIVGDTNEVQCTVDLINLLVDHISQAGHAVKIIIT